MHLYRLFSCLFKLPLSLWLSICPYFDKGNVRIKHTVGLKGPCLQLKFGGVIEEVSVLHSRTGSDSGCLQ